MFLGVLMASIADLGKERANPEANANNVLRLEDCPCTDAATCEDILDLAGTIDMATDYKLQSITLGGNVLTAVNATVLTVANRDATLAGEIAALIEPYEIGAVVNVTGSGVEATSDFTISHFGALAITDVTLVNASGTTASLTVTSRYCTLQIDCEYKVSGEGTSVTLTDGVDDEPILLPYVVGDSATNETTRGVAETTVDAFYTAQGLVNSANRVEVNVFNGEFDLFVTVASDVDMDNWALGGVKFTKVGCVESFVSP